MSSSKPSPDRIVATLQRYDVPPESACAPHEADLFVASGRIVRRQASLTPGLRKARGRAALGSTASGLIIQHVGHDRHVPAFKINWRHPLALPLCCILCFAIPCVIVLRAHVIYERRYVFRRSFHAWRARRSGRGQ